MWTRLGYATASGILGILAIETAFFAYALTGRCGPAYALIAPFLAAIFFSPVLLVVAGVSGLIGYNAKRKALAGFGMLLALALGSAGIVQAVPHHDYPTDSPQCRFDP
ncbi:MAG: hypothetical protein WB491_04960 [Candidatus Aquilonibacter sp.]